jgi:hypothetical protein
MDPLPQGATFFDLVQFTLQQPIFEGELVPSCPDLLIIKHLSTTRLSTSA